MSDFEKMCIELNKAKKSGLIAITSGTDYESAYKVVKEYVCNDKKKLLNLKGEARASDFFGYFSSIGVYISFLVSFFHCYFL